MASWRSTNLAFAILVAFSGLSLMSGFRVEAAQNVYFAGFFPMTGENKEDISGGIMPAINLAIRHINDSPDILPNYKLDMLWNDTKVENKDLHLNTHFLTSLFQCNPGVGLKSFFDMVHQTPHKLFLYGATCSPVTDQIAKAARHWNLVQISYADTHPMFTENTFPHFFRIVQSENEYNPPRLSLLRYFNWTRVGTLYQNEAKYSLVSWTIAVHINHIRF